MVGLKRLGLFFLVMFLFALVTGLSAVRGEFKAPLSPADIHFVDSGQALGGNAPSRHVALGDVDGDGDLDALVAGDVGGPEIWVNDGRAQGGTEGIFRLGGQVLGTDAATDLALADLDGDGDLDVFLLVLALQEANRVWINQGGLQGGDEGSFAFSGQSFGGLGAALSVDDLDGDGDVDAYVPLDSGLGAVWLNDGSGTFAESAADVPIPGVDVALGDLDGDGDLDVFSVMESTVDSANRVGVNQGGAQNGAGGTFADSGQRLGSAASRAVALGDVDGDGDVDAFVGNNGANRVWVNEGGLQGGAVGTFVEGTSFLGDESAAVALADLNADGDLDAFVGNAGGNVVWVNYGGVEGGSEGTFVDSGQTLGTSTTEDVALGDVDGDGDLDAFVANWGAPNKVWLNLAATEVADVSVSLPPTDYIEVASGDCLFGSTSFVVTVHNAGPAAATNVTVSSDRGDFDWPYGNPVYIIGLLGPGESAELYLEDVAVYDPQLSTVVCTATANVRVTADQDDPDPENNRSTAQTIWYRCDNLCSISQIFCQDDTGVSPAADAGESGTRAGQLLQSLQDEVIDLIVYYYVRDGVLANSGDGQHYIDLYYTHDAEIRSLLEANVALEAEAVTTLQLWEPNLWALVRGRGDAVTITGEQVAAVDGFLTDLSAVASPDLQEAIAAERDRLPPPEAFVGMTVEEARALTVGYGLYLPAIAQE